MGITSAGLLLVLAAPAALGQDPPPAPPPTPERIEAAVQNLERAFLQGELGERLRAIEEAADLADPKVIRALAQGLGDREGPVRLAAVEALRFQHHPAALAELHAALEKERIPKVEDKELAELILAIGQHASASSFELLAGRPLDSLHEHSNRARILALGRIRTPASVSELIALMNKAGRGARGHTQFQGDFRLALWALTGTDEGIGIAGWQRWWNDHKHALELPDELAEKPRQLALRWRVTWITPAERKQVRKREPGERGGG